MVQKPQQNAILIHRSAQYMNITSFWVCREIINTRLTQKTTNTAASWEAASLQINKWQDAFEQKPTVEVIFRQLEVREAQRCTTRPSLELLDNPG